jgi:hypothetical protein
MPAKPTQEIKEEVVVKEINTNDSNFKAVEAVSSKVVTQKQFEDFIESSQFLGTNSLFVKYDFFIDEGETLGDKKHSVSKQVEEDFNKPVKINKSKGRDFNIDFIDNFLSLAKQNLTTQEFSDFMTSLPTQIKALFLYQLSFVKNIKNTTASDLITNLKTQAIINLNYFKLVHVEIHNGYETNSDGEIMISRPKFRSLKKQDLDSLSTTTMCRLRTYNNRELKIDNDLLSFAIQKHNFFIKPDTLAPKRMPIRTQQQEAKSITSQHFVANQYDLIGSTTNIITQPGNVSSEGLTPQMSSTPNTTSQTNNDISEDSSVAVSTQTSGGY